MGINTSELNKSLKQAKEWVESVREDDEDFVPDASRSALVWSMADWGSIYIQGESFKSYRECIRSFYNAINGKKSKVELLSEREIEQAFQSCVLHTLDIENQRPETSFEERLDENIGLLKDRLTKPPTSWDVYIGVEGFKSELSCFRFGKTSFLPGDKSTLRELRRKTYRTVLMPPKIGDKKFFVKKAREDLLEEYSGKKIAHIEVKAVDREAAHALALKELTLTLDVLNFYITYVHPCGTRVQLYLPGQALFHASTLTLIFEGEETVQFNSGLAGPIERFHVSGLNGRRSNAIGVPEASLLLRTEERNNFQERLIAALRFAGRACVNETREESFLGFAIALESLLGDAQSEGEITYKLATRCAHLLGSDAEKRKEIYSNIKKLYAVRSQIVHRGNTEVTDIQLSQVRNYARYALVAVLTRDEFQHFRTGEQFLEWFEEKIIS